MSAARTHEAVILSERLLITRIITSVALALLLVVGAWMATHTEPQVAAPAASTVTEHVGAPIAAGAPVIDQGTSSTVLGVAVCVLGVLCGLLLVVVTRWVHRTRQPQPERGLLPLPRALLPAPAPPRLTASTLTQLSISRT